MFIGQIPTEMQNNGTQLSSWFRNPPLACKILNLFSITQCWIFSRVYLFSHRTQQMVEISEFRWFYTKTENIDKRGWLSISGWILQTFMNRSGVTSRELYCTSEFWGESWVILYTKPILNILRTKPPQQLKIKLKDYCSAIYPLQCLWL